jgi:hypothetical protein
MTRHRAPEGRHRHRRHLNPVDAVPVGLLRLESGLPARIPDGGARHAEPED